MKTTDKHTPERDRYLEMAERYFLAELSREEEQELKLFITHEGLNDSSFDEIRAVMGFFSAKRKNHGRIPSGQSRAGNKVLPFVWRAAGAAAAIALLLVLWPKKDAHQDYISYSDGRTVTDPEMVMQNVEDVLGKIFGEESGPGIDDILDNILNK